MSGIAGWVDYTKRLSNENEVIKAMTRSFTRGKSASEGFWVSEHTLLGSSDCRDEKGDSHPVICKRGSAMFVLVFCGELYNRDDIIKELEAKGRKLDEKDSSHAILHAYMEWGEAFLEKLNGVFSLCIRDTEKDEIILCRDRLGVKPLFYSMAKNSLIFASEIKAILAHPYITPRLNTESLSEIFAIGPARTPGHGIFAGINELKPGHYAVMSQSKLEIKRYWSLVSMPHEENFDETAETVRELLFDSARRMFYAGGEPLFLLSGGLDSSALCAVAAKEFESPLKTFSLDYVDNDVNFRASAFQPNSDAPWVRRVSDFIKSKHENILIDTPELTNGVFTAVHARDLPGMTDIDSSLFLFSRSLKNHGDVGITGECADEIFGGYPWFYRGQDAETFPWAQKLSSRTEIYTPELSGLIKPEEYVQSRYEEALAEVPILEGETREEARVRKISYLTITRWLPTLLDRQDRMSTRAGLILRAPFSDYRLTEYMWNVPWSMKYRRNREKGLLRHALNGVLPDDVLWRKKSPFPKTHNPNYIEVLRKLTIGLINEGKSPVFRFVNKEKLKKLAQTMTRETDIPWFGQLMNAPQLLAYLLQIDYWISEYNISL